MQKLNLFVSYFESEDKERQKELSYCRDHHKTCGIFSEIIEFSNRPTYDDFFKATEKYPSDINILSNADIVFNETILESRNMGKNDAYALTRWEVKDGEIVPFEDMHDYNKEAKARHSQDVWIFNGTARGVWGPFHIGVPGCDNRMAYEIQRSNYRLTNPSNKIKCVHIHADQERNYNIPNGYNDRVPPPYRWVDVDTEKPVRRPI